jgi:hypothetical protein
MRWMTWRATSARPHNEVGSEISTKGQMWGYIGGTACIIGRRLPSSTSQLNLSRFMSLKTSSARIYPTKSAHVML